MKPPNEATQRVLNEGQNVQASDRVYRALRVGVRGNQQLVQVVR